MLERPKLITIFFDLEGPFLWKKTERFDLENTVQSISQVLNRFNVKAVFNTCGILAENFPKLVSNLYNEGHEIASHGYAHENFLEISTSQLDKILAKTEKILENITGERPIGIRSPWALRNNEIYSVLNDRDYKWASNWYLPFWTTKSRVDLRTLSYPEWILWETYYRIRWIFHRKVPFKIGNVTEIPLVSPLDISCIYPFPEPMMKSPKSSLDEAYKIYVRHHKSSKGYFNLNFHPHTIGTNNRIELLKNILEYLSRQQNTRFALPRELLESPGIP